MEVDDLPAQRQADASPRIGVTGMQPLEYHEDPLPVSRFDPDSVVLAGELPLAAVLLGGETDDRGHINTAELDRVAHQVREQLYQQRPVSGDHGQPVDGDGGVAVLYRGLELRHRLAGDLVEVDRAEVSTGLTDAREREQVVDQALHALRAIDRVGDVLPGSLVELVGVPRLKHLAETGHFAQRFLQVMGGDVGELLEFPVGPLQLGGLERDVVEAEYQLTSHRLDVCGQFHDLAGPGDVDLVVQVTRCDRLRLAPDGLKRPPDPGRQADPAGHGSQYQQHADS